MIKLIVFKPVSPGSCGAVCSETKWTTTWHSSGTHHLQLSGTYDDQLSCSQFSLPLFSFYSILYSFFFCLLSLRLTHIWFVCHICECEMQVITVAVLPGDNAWIWEFYVTCPDWCWVDWQRLSERGCSRFPHSASTLADQGPLTETGYGVREQAVIGVPLFFVFYYIIVTLSSSNWFFLLLLKDYLRVGPRLSVRLLLWRLQ